MTLRQTIRGHLRRTAAAGLRRLADYALDAADILDGDGEDTEDASDASAAIDARDPIAIALKGCVEIPQPLPR